MGGLSGGVAALEVVEEVAVDVGGGHVGGEAGVA